MAVNVTPGEALGKASEKQTGGRVDLAVVMPVYNESDCVARVIRSWLGTLTSENINFRMIVLNDGSTDDTSSRLAAFKDDHAVEVIDKPNSGHGPTILQGYKRAVEMADWVFQCDSDDEIRPDHFPTLWRSRRKFDALFGVRSDRSQMPSRRIVSACSNLTVRLLFGRGIKDANTPYRLIRASLLGRILEQIPPNTFAPNVIISGAMARSRARIMNHPVFWEHRRTGKPSIVRWRILRSAMRAFWQTLRCRPRVNELEGRHEGTGSVQNAQDCPRR